MVAGAGGLFATLCPGIELNPPIRYNGSAKRGKLEKVFEAAARNALKTGDEGQMGKLDRLQVRRARLLKLFVAHSHFLPFFFTSSALNFRIFRC